MGSAVAEDAAEVAKAERAEEADPDQRRQLHLSSVTASQRKERAPMVNSADFNMVKPRPGTCASDAPQ